MGKLLRLTMLIICIFFEIYDETIRDYRQFYSLMYEVGYNYSVPVLFEIVIEGKLSLLLRERIVAESISNNYFPSYYSYSMMPRYNNNYSYVNKVKYDYFFLENSGKIIKFNGKKRDLFNVMSDKTESMKTYFNKNRINLKKMSDLAKVISYYNRI